MIQIQIKDAEGTLLLAKVLRTDHSIERMQGWMGRKSVAPDEGLLIVPCASIHTVGMAFDIDIAFLDGQDRVAKLLPSVKPGRWAWAPLRLWLQPWAAQTLEMPAGSIASLGLKVGQQLQIEERA